MQIFAVRSCNTEIRIWGMVPLTQLTVTSNPTWQIACSSPILQSELFNVTDQGPLPSRTTLRNHRRWKSRRRIALLLFCDVSQFSISALKNLQIKAFQGSTQAPTVFMSSPQTAPRVVSNNVILVWSYLHLKNSFQHFCNIQGEYSR